MLAEEKITPVISEPKQDSNAQNAAFSTSRYWCFGTGVSGLKSQYGTSYPTYVYDSNSIIYQYVEAYETYLKENFGINNVSASIISREQLVNDLNCSSITDGCNNSPYASWLVKSYTWHTGTAIGGDYYSLVKVSTSGFPNSGQNFQAGIRPIVTVPKSEIN